MCFLLLYLKKTVFFLLWASFFSCPPQYLLFIKYFILFPGKCLKSFIIFQNLQFLFGPINQKPLSGLGEYIRGIFITRQGEGGRGGNKINQIWKIRNHVNG